MEQISPSINETFDRKIEKYLNEEKGGKLAANYGSLLYQKIYQIFSVLKCLSNLFSDVARIREHALMAIQKDTDIVYLLTKIKEISKFKSLFFNKYQTKLFEHFQKERINSFGRERTNVRTTSLNFMNKNSRRKSIFEQKSKKRETYKHMELYDSFSLVWDKNVEDERNFNLNEKILKEFDKELMEIFKDRWAKEKHITEFNTSNSSSLVDVIGRPSLPLKPSEFKKAHKKRTIEFDKLIKERL